MNWRSSLGLGDSAKKQPNSGGERNTVSPRNGATELVVVDKHRSPITTLVLSFADVQSEAESMVGADGDPIAAMQTLVQQRLRDADAELSDKSLTDLRKAVSKAAMNSTTAVPRIELVGSRVERTPSVSSRSEAPSLPSELFDKVLVYPNDRAQRQYEMLVGLDDTKKRLEKEAIVLTQPKLLEEWALKKHGTTKLRALATIDHGAPLIIFAGDVGAGKTAIAESFGDAVARKIGTQVFMMRLSIQTRGSGFVGDMTKQIIGAIRMAESEARRTGRVTILLLDEADSLAESRETKQMHHEDRAGVNALIQGVDRLRGSGLPVLVVFCTNRLDSIDPAIQRRAADVFRFPRPNPQQRRAHLERLLGDVGFSEVQWLELVDLTGPLDGREYGFTYSDIADRLVRTAVIEAFPDMRMSFEIVKSAAKEMVPTRPFGALHSD